MEINTNSIANPYGNDYNYMNFGGLKDLDKYDAYPLTLLNSQNFVKNSPDFNNAWNPIITARENNFVNQLNAWKTKHSIIINQENVFVFGEYQTINWKISGLEIKPLSLPYYITSQDTTRASNTSESLKILEKLFVGPDALFQYEKNYAIEQTLGFKVLLNPDAYDGFIKRNVTNQTVYDYVTTQTKDFGVKNNRTSPHMYLWREVRYKSLSKQEAFNKINEDYKEFLIDKTSESIKQENKPNSNDFNPKTLLDLHTNSINPEELERKLNEKAKTTGITDHNELEKLVDLARGTALKSIK
ncbi:hypothetical protein [Spiroplasma endosymbiont of Virgichneumon dumeticola]|uniref:hypothetical protein n=1 Tax=Spiroplasma endosymbiont of Virgichneumon dumeticola TaxID=3139323 RepID=UPI0035C88A4B